VKIVAEKMMLPEADILSRKKSTHITYGRHIAMYILHHRYRYSFCQLADLWGYKNHSSVRWGVQKIKDQLPTYDDLKNDVNLINKKLNTIQ